MKNIFKSYFFISISLVMLIKSAGAQCTPPDLSFVSPTLVEGVALQEGAVYKFANVSPGIDCFLTLLKFNGGATLTSMENVGLGYNDAWQPIINGPGAPVGNKSWIDWSVKFKTTAGDPYNFPCLAICAIDVDGDSGNIGEFIESDGQATYELPFPTVLTVTDKGSGRIEAQGPVANRAGIDTFSLDVRINYYFNGMDSIQLKIGQTVLGPGTGGATGRYNSIYFKKVVLNPFTILPLSFMDVKAEKVSNILRNISWKITPSSTPTVKFEIESTENHNTWETIAAIPNEANKYNYSYNTKSYSDNTVYYRIKAYDEQGKIIISQETIIKKTGNDRWPVKVTPNPANSVINISCPDASFLDTRLLQIIDFTGRQVLEMPIKKQNTQIDCSRFVEGYYVVNVIEGNSVFSMQILINHK